jgi:hypothetical protein
VWEERWSGGCGQRVGGQGDGCGAAWMGSGEPPASSSFPHDTSNPPAHPHSPSLRPAQTTRPQERASILGLHRAVFSASTGDLRTLQLAASPEDTLWAASMVNSRCFADEARAPGGGGAWAMS